MLNFWNKCSDSVTCISKATCYIWHYPALVCSGTSLCPHIVAIITISMFGNVEPIKKKTLSIVARQANLWSVSSIASQLYYYCFEHDAVLWILLYLPVYWKGNSEANKASQSRPHKIIPITLQFFLILSLNLFKE